MTAPGKARNVVDVLPERLRALLAHAVDGVWVTSQGGRIVFWNRAAEVALGYRAQDVVGHNCDVVTGRVDQGWPRCGCEGALRRPTGCELTFGVPTSTKNGQQVWLEVTALVTNHPAGANGHAPTAFVVHVFREATRRRELLQSLRAHVSSPATDARLTARELDVLRLMSQGLGTAAAAERLRVSRATIRNHVQNIFAKLKVHTRLQAVLDARARDLL
jgi:PAS domain S-box-containing protein